MRKVAQSPLDNVLDDDLLEDDLVDSEDEETPDSDSEDEAPKKTVYEVLFSIDYDAGVDPHETWDQEKESRKFAEDLFEDMFGVKLENPDPDYGIQDDTAFMFMVPKDQIKEVLAKIHEFSDMDGGDFIPLIDGLVAFNFSVVDPAGDDDMFPRSDPFEDEIRFSEWEKRL